MGPDRLHRKRGLPRLVWNRLSADPAGREPARHQLLELPDAAARGGVAPARRRSQAASPGGDRLADCLARRGRGRGSASDGAPGARPASSSHVPLHPRHWRRGRESAPSRVLPARPAPSPACVPPQRGDGRIVSGVVRDPAGVAVAGRGGLSPEPAGSDRGRDAQRRRGRVPVRRGARRLLRPRGRVPRPRHAAAGRQGRGGPARAEPLPSTCSRRPSTTRSPSPPRPGAPPPSRTSPQRVNVIGEEEIALRSKAVLAQAASEEVGLQLQRTSPTIGGVFVRGLTGTKVNVYVDGVRYTTSAQRGGISTFFNMVEPESLEGIEVVRGPSSAEYGSDALGGHGAAARPAPRPSAPRAAGSPGAGTRASAARTRASARPSSGATPRPRFGLLGTLAGRRVNTLRPGGGEDSHNAVTRFLGLPVDRRRSTSACPDTAFTQYGGHLKTSWAITPTAQLSASYLRGQQDGGKRYDQLLGGDGNLVADLRNLMADHFYARFEKAQAGFLDRLTLTYSFSAQREERVNQGGNGNPRASVNHEPERTTAHGLQAAAHRAAGRHDLTLGGDVYFEGIAAPSFSASPTTGATTVRRGRVPDGARYRHGGVFLQDVFEAVPGRLRLNGAAALLRRLLRGGRGRARSRTAEPLWPADSYDTSAFTFRLGALWTVGRSVEPGRERQQRLPRPRRHRPRHVRPDRLGVRGVEPRGRGARGDGGHDRRRVGGEHRARPVAVLAPETSLSYELTLRFRSRRLKADVTVFQTDVDDNVAKQSLILPPGAVGLSLAGEPDHAPAPERRRLRRRLDQPRPRAHQLRRRPDPRARGDARRGARGVASCSAGRFTWLHAEDRATGSRRTSRAGRPPPRAGCGCAGRRTAAGASGSSPTCTPRRGRTACRRLDLGDRRTGASRSRSSIASFFTNGARARGLVAPGPDGVAGNADDVLAADRGDARPGPGPRPAGRARRRRSSPRFPATPSSACAGPSGSPRATRSSSTSRTSATRTTGASRGAWTPPAAGSTCGTPFEF